MVGGLSLQVLPGASQLRIPARSWLEGRDSSEVSLFFLISHYYGRIGLLTVVDLSMVDAPCLTGARGDDSGQLPVWDNSEGEDSEVTEDMALEFLARQLVNWTGCCLTQCWPCGLPHCQCRYWLPGTQQRVRLARTWRTRLSLGGLWFGAKDLAKEADVKASRG